MTINEKAQPLTQPTPTSRAPGVPNGASTLNSVQATARMAAVLYLVIAVAAGVAHGFVPSQLIVAGDAASTASNIAASEALLRFGGVGSELIVLLSEIVVSVLLYVLLKPVNKTLSLLAAVSRLAIMIAEIAFPLWLLIKGVNATEWEKRALAVA